MRNALPFLGLMGFLAGCGSTLSVDVQLIDPCNQEAVQSVDFLRFEPRGTDVDSEGLATIQAVTDGETADIPIPVVSDFHLAVTGHAGTFDGEIKAVGVSPKYDLTSTADQLSIRLPFALVNSFYKTTSLESPTECTNLAVGRYGATATYLPENGRVLIVGGAKLADGFLEYPRAVELYNPQTGSFEVVQELKSGGARAFHTATRLADGRVLIAGGEAHVQNAVQSLQSAFIVDARDPSDVNLSEGLAMRFPRAGHQAVQLDNGKVLLVGGRQLISEGSLPTDHIFRDELEIFDPDNRVFVLPTDETSNAVSLATARFGHTATLLSTGNHVAVAGGMDGSGPVLSMEIVAVNGDNYSVTPVTDTLGVGAIRHAADLDDMGNLVLSGGYATVNDSEGAPPVNAVPDVEIWSFDIGTGALSKTCSAAMNKGRGYHTASVVGRTVVFIGGRGDTGAPIADAEVATILAQSGTCFATAPATQGMSDPRAQHAVAEIEDSGELLVVGGRQQDAGDQFGRSITSTEIFSPLRAP